MRCVVKTREPRNLTELRESLGQAGGERGSLGESRADAPFTEDLGFSFCCKSDFFPKGL